MSSDEYTWNNQTYTQGGTYTYQTTNSEGCDSTATLNLTILNSTSSTTDVTECDQYTWNNQTYTQSGTYTFQTTNSEGCDSTATLKPAGVRVRITRSQIRTFRSRPTQRKRRSWRQ